MKCYDPYLKDKWMIGHFPLYNSLYHQFPNQTKRFKTLSELLRKTRRPGSNIALGIVRKVVFTFFRKMKRIEK